MHGYLLTASSVISFSADDERKGNASHTRIPWRCQLSPVSCYPSHMMSMRRFLNRACALEVRKSAKSTACLLISMMKTNHDRWHSMMFDIEEKFYYTQVIRLIFVCALHISLIIAALHEISSIYGLAIYVDLCSSFCVALCAFVQYREIQLEIYFLKNLFFSTILRNWIKNFK